MRTLFSIWSWLVLAVVAVGGFFLAVPLAIITRPFDRRRGVPGRFLRLLGVVIAKLNPQWSFSVECDRDGYRPRRTVVVANHVSNSDAFLIAHVPWEMKWLCKSSLFFIPFVGWLMWLANDVPVKRGVRDSAKLAMGECRKHLERGMPVMIFPEGTRSRTGELLPFRDGAFRLAIEAGAEVLPLAVAGTREALPKHSWRFGRARGVVVVGEPIATDGMTLEDLPTLKAQTRAAIEALYAEIAPRTAL